MDLDWADQTDIITRFNLTGHKVDESSSLLMQRRDKIKQNLLIRIVFLLADFEFKYFK